MAFHDKIKYKTLTTVREKIDRKYRWMIFLKKYKFRIKERPSKKPRRNRLNKWKSGPLEHKPALNIRGYNLIAVSKGYAVINFLTLRSLIHAQRNEKT